MSPLVFLALAAGVSLVGILILWLRHRVPADTPDSSIEEFRSKMRALSEDQPGQSPSGVTQSGVPQRDLKQRDLTRTEPSDLSRRGG
ncbi:MAG: hypothetical protein H6517_07735 [Microthrixaceae bacterium]|nr:hypothetical protein [Microthrixaceae bacterium]MCO5322679.1 hypothetical protein [Microthrixaceae bacterium]